MSLINVNAQTSEGYFTAASIKHNAGDYKGAIKDYDKAIGLNPQYAEAYCNRGNAKYNSGDDHGAIQEYDKAIVLNLT